MKAYRGKHYRSEKRVQTVIRAILSILSARFRRAVQQRRWARLSRAKHIRRKT